MSDLVSHAEFELRRAGLFDADSDYGGMLATGVMKIVKVFAEEGHSGFSAARTVQLLERLLRFKPLTPITNDPMEWVDVSDMSGEPTWQNRRASSCFSNDGGKTHYDIATDGDRVIVTTANAVTP